MIKIKITGVFTQQLESLYLKNQEIHTVIKKRIILFQNNPQDTRLKNHALTKRLQGKWAFSITDDVRIIYMLVGENTAFFSNWDSCTSIWQENLITLLRGL